MRTAYQVPTGNQLERSLYNIDAYLNPFNIVMVVLTTYRTTFFFIGPQPPFCTLYNLKGYEGVEEIL
jgi:hypothetical protein